MNPNQLTYDPKHGIGRIQREDPHSDALRYLVRYDDTTLKWLGNEEYHRQVAAYNEAVKTGKPLVLKPSATATTDDNEQDGAEPQSYSSERAMHNLAKAKAKASTPVRLHFERK